MDKVDRLRLTGNRGVQLPWLLLALASLVMWIQWTLLSDNSHSLLFRENNAAALPYHSNSTLERCRRLALSPGPPDDFASRKVNDRFVKGTRAVWIKNATVWTGNDDGREVLHHADIVLRNGLIYALGDTDLHETGLHNDIEVINANGAWITPGLVDMHTHLGDAPSPELSATGRDDNSRKGPILPWLRSIDALNTHDDSYQLSISGGITTALVLPGSANAIGGQAFPIKLRTTKERSPTSKLVEVPDFYRNSTTRPVWRHMKHACGENPGRVYSNSRMDTYWSFREAYNKAKEIKVAQDEYCSKAKSGEWGSISHFPEDLQWEALVDVLRSRVKVHIHCYETVDLDAISRLTNEFQFPIAAFHHAHEAYLGTEVVKNVWGETPAIAIFATNARYKREAYRGSEFAARILTDNGLRVAMKSDHPVLNSRFLLYEAQQAHYYGLDSNLALSTVTTTPSQVLALDHRLGFLRVGYDADVVIWDSHPLRLGATPTHVFIDGISQFANATSALKPRELQSVPKRPDFSKEIADVLKYDGLPPLEGRPTQKVLFTNVAEAWSRDGDNIVTLTSSDPGHNPGLFSVLVENGKISCLGLGCTKEERDGVKIIDLERGALSPALITYGSELGLVEIEQEPSTHDGSVIDPLTDRIPSLLGENGSVIRAADGLSYGGRDLLLSYRAGVTSAVTAPSHDGFMAGLGTAFNLESRNRLQAGAIVQEVTAMHVAIHPNNGVSISTQIGALRELLTGNGSGNLGRWFQKVSKGDIPLVIEVESADTMASLVALKGEVEKANGSPIRVTFSGATEAPLLADELAAANVGVVLRPSRSFPSAWESRRIMPGQPLSEFSPVAYLSAHNVTVGIGIKEIWEARNTRFDASWVAVNAPDQFKFEEALALVSTNLEILLGVETGNSDIVATAGGNILNPESKVVAIINSRHGVVDIFDGD